MAMPKSKKRKTLRGVKIPKWLTLPVLQAWAVKVRYVDSGHNSGYLCTVCAEWLYEQRLDMEAHIRLYGEWKTFLNDLKMGTGIAVFNDYNIKHSKVPELATITDSERIMSVANRINNIRRLIFLNRIAEALK